MKIKPTNLDLFHIQDIISIDVLMFMKQTYAFEEHMSEADISMVTVDTVIGILEHNVEVWTNEDRYGDEIPLVKADIKKLRNLDPTAYVNLYFADDVVKMHRFVARAKNYCEDLKRQIETLSSESDQKDLLLNALSKLEQGVEGVIVEDFD